MKAKRQLKSRVFFNDRHVHAVQYHPVDDDCSHCVVKCKVLPSLPTLNKKENPDYNVWACLSKITGNVHSADCNCTAGRGEACNHIGALLHALVDITDKKKDGLLSSTSTKCAWNNPRKRKLSPKRSQDMSFRKSTSTSTGEERTETTNVLKTTVNEDRFRMRLMQNKSKAGWLTNFERREDRVIPSVNSNIPFMYHDKKDLSGLDTKLVFEEFFDNMSISEEQSRKIESESKGQSNSTVWSTQRHGRITSSNFSSVVNRKETTPPDNLVKQLFGYTTFDNKYVKWGRDHEPAARRMYENEKQKVHPSISVRQCGLFINTSHPHLGASPDGLVFDPSEENSDGLIEIKCPAADVWRNSAPTDCAKDPKFFCKLDENGDITLKRSHPYYLQIQGQMGITGRAWCDFVVWTLKQPHSVERVYFDSELWKSMVVKLDGFYKKAMIPEMFTSRVKRGIPLY